MSTPRDYALTFSGAGTQEVGAVGRFLRVLSAPSSGAFFSINGGTELFRQQGQSINLDSEFDRVRVRSTVAQTVRFTVSDIPQDDNSQELVATVTATIAAGDTLTSTADQSVVAASASQVIAGRADRLTVTIKNLASNAAPIRVGDASVTATRGHELAPGESVTLSTTSAVFVYNTHAAAQSVSILEVRDV